MVDGVDVDDGALARATNHLEDLRLGGEDVDVVEQGLQEEVKI